jgi:hypothetical protein
MHVLAAYMAESTEWLTAPLSQRGAPLLFEAGIFYTSIILTAIWYRISTDEGKHAFRKPASPEGLEQCLQISDYRRR